MSAYLKYIMMSDKKYIYEIPFCINLQLLRVNNMENVVNFYPVFRLCIISIFKGALCSFRKGNSETKIILTFTILIR